MNGMLKKQWANFQESRTGAAMLMVLLVMVFVVIMGSSVMFTSYNSYMMRLVERSGVDTFYTTEELTDLVRVNVQEAASSALETAYTRVMAEYAFIQAECLYDDVAVQEAAQLKFNEYFIEELTKVTVPSVDGTGEVLLFQLDSTVNLSTEIASSSPNITGSYSTNALQEMLPDVDGSVGVSGMTGHTASYTGALSGTNFDNGTLDASGNAGSETTGSAGNFYYTYGDDGYPRLVLEYVTVGFVSEGEKNSEGVYETNSFGYETNITTDIIIEMPIFTHTGDTHLGFTGDSGSVEVKNEDAIPFDGASSIGRYWVKHSKPNTSDSFLVTGDLYGGTFYIFNASDVDPTDIEFSHNTGRLITKYGDVVVDDQEINDHYITATGLTSDDEYLTLDGIGIYSGTSLVTYDESQVWTNSLTVTQGSDLVLSEKTETYFKKDITIAGGVETGNYNQTKNNTSNISLGGKIVGFSTGATAATSSAITINGSDVMLDMSNLKSIILGGSAYLEIGRSILGDGYETATSYGEYQLGQSIAATPDALAYLVPTEALVASFDITSNPFMTTSSSGFDATIDRSHSSIPVSGMSSLVSDKPQVISRQYRIEGQTYYLIYYFYDFVSDAARNTYLMEYNKNSTAFQNNLELFVDFVGADVEGNISSPDVLQSQGVFYYLDKDGNLNMVNGSDTANAGLSSYDTEFFNTSITLWPHMSPNDNYKATIYNHLADGNEQATSVGTVSEYLAKENNTTLVDNPFDYYVNFHGDNLNVDINYSGALLHPDDVDEDSIWMYFKDVADTEVSDPYTRSGLVSWVSGMSDDGLSYNGTATGGTRPDYVREGTWGYEFYLGGPNPLDPSDKSNCVAIFTAVGCHLWEGRDPSGDPTANMKTGVIYTDSYPNLHLVISRAGANVEAEFKGLVFAETGIALTAPINSTVLNTGFIEIMHSYCTLPNGEIRYLYEFFRNLNMVGDYEEGNDGSGYLAPGVSEDDAKVNWKPNDLVYYENWERY